jgi:hypothetical protein
VNTPSYNKSQTSDECRQYKAYERITKKLGTDKALSVTNYASPYLDPLDSGSTLSHLKERSRLSNITSHHISNITSHHISDERENEKQNFLTNYLAKSHQYFRRAIYRTIAVIFQIARLTVRFLQEQNTR